MRQIFKYPLKMEGGMVVISAAIKKVLKIKIQNGTAVMWAVVDPMGEPFDMLVASVGTGWKLGDKFDNWNYVGTVIDNMTDYVWHFFATVAEEDWEDPIAEGYRELMEDDDILWS